MYRRCESRFKKLCTPDIMTTLYEKLTITKEIPHFLYASYYFPGFFFELIKIKIVTYVLNIVPDPD